MADAGVDAEQMGRDIARQKIREAHPYELVDYVPKTPDDDAQQRFEEELGRKPTDEELAQFGAGYREEMAVLEKN